jgi:hypothetical protein
MGKYADSLRVRFGCIKTEMAQVITAVSLVARTLNW